MGGREYDVIGDVHGCGEKLVGLLSALGWRAAGSEPGGWAPPHADRQAIFVGDLVDRGDDHLAVLTTVRAMVEAGTAHIVMGNHELNAVSFATAHPDEPGRHLRERSEKNLRQHRAFLEQLDPDQRAEWIAWFETLPLWLDLGELRVVHACWHQPSIDALERAFGGDRFPDDPTAWVAANTKGDPVWQAVEVLLKGPEVALGDYGLPPYLDKDGNPRAHARARWWNAGAVAIGDLLDIPAGATTEDGAPYPELPPLPCAPGDRTYAYGDDVPVVYGHHWRRWAPDEHLDWTSTTACVDFSAVRGGPLVAYAWRGERTIDPTHYVPSPSP